MLKRRSCTLNSQLYCLHESKRVLGGRWEATRRRRRYHHHTLDTEQWAKSIVTCWESWCCRTLWCQQRQGHLPPCPLHSLVNNGREAISALWSSNVTLVCCYRAWFQHKLCSDDELYDLQACIKTTNTTWVSEHNYMQYEPIHCTQAKVLPLFSEVRWLRYSWTSFTNTDCSEVTVHNSKIYKKLFSVDFG